MISTIAIPVVLLILISLTLWFVYYTKGMWISKAIITPIVLASTIFVWYSMEDLLGWPTPIELPQKYQLHWILVQEPNKDDDGGIYLLVNDISIREHRDIRIGSYVATTKEPRVHKIPYSRLAHEQAEKLQGMLRQGRSVFMSRGQGDEGKDGKAQGLGDKEGKDGKGTGGEGGNQEAPFGYLMPPPKLPSKRAP